MKPSCRADGLLVAENGKERPLYSQTRLDEYRAASAALDALRPASGL